MPTLPQSVHLTSAGVSALFDLSTGGLPALDHWGPALPALDEAAARAIASANYLPVVSNQPDVSFKPALLAEGHRGWLGRPGISGHREGADWTPKFAITAVSLNGDSLGAGHHEAGAATLSVTASDPLASLTVTLTSELTESGLLRTRAELTNTGATDYTLDNLTLTYPLPPEATEILDFGGSWTQERTPQRTSIHQGTYLREGRRGRTGADYAFVLHAGRPGFGFRSGELWGVHTGFSGNHTHLIEHAHNGMRVIGGGELLLPGEVTLSPGASYGSPWVYGVYSGTGLDAAAHRFHSFLRGRDRRVDAARPVTINVWEAVYFDHDLDRLKDLADRAADLGVERFVLDDGWFGSRRDDFRGLGDWHVSPEVWPEGLTPLIDYVHERGMQFGLWFEAEMVNLDSDVARAHPEWVMAPNPQRMPVESRHQQVLNLTIPECYDYVLGAVSAVLRENAIDYIKWDHNRDLVESATRATGRAAVHEQTLAIYRMFDTLRAEFPSLEIESCASGGARIDLEMMQRTDRVWVSDCIDPLERQRMNRWTTQLLPPEFMGSHIASGSSHTTGRTHTLTYRASVAVFGHLGIEWDLAQASAAELSDLREWIAFYKAERGLLLGGDLVRVDTDESLSLHGVVTPDASRALFSFGINSLTGINPLGRLRFPGLAADAQYRIRPLLIGTVPGDLKAPAWFGLPGSQETPTSSNPWPQAIREPVDLPGVVLSGAALEHVGVQAPAMFPEQALLFEINRI
ncbi:alpha-galactosidase [Micrococcales bacterium 31B]|nr:alpha-galactosidase [Micrococcales bacterium 31B]